MDLTHWYTESEASSKLGLTDRTFRRHIASKKVILEARKRPRLNKKPETVYNPTDVDALVVEARTHVMPKASTVPARMQQPVEKEYVEPLILLHRMYLSLSEASMVSGLPKSFLRRHAPQLAFKAGRSWRFPRTLLGNTARVSELAGSPLVMTEGQPPVAALPGSLLS